MRILFCNYEYPPLGGGGGVSNALLAEELGRRHEVAVLTSQAFGLKPESVINGVRVMRVPVHFRRNQAAASLVSMLVFLPNGVRRGRELLRAERFDVINTHFALPSGPVGDRLARISGIPNVLSLHGGDIFDPSKFTSPHRHAVLRGWVRRLLRRATRVVNTSGDIALKVRTYYDSEVDLVQIPLGIRRPVFRPSSRVEHQIGETDIVLLTVGRLVPRKAIDQLIRVVRDIGHPQVRLFVIGDGPERANLEAEARAAGVADKVRFLGQVEEETKNQIYSLSDIYVSTSQHEGFGLVFLEAMAGGLPLAVYDFGGQTDFLREGINGHVVALNDIEQFTRCVRSLIESGAERRTFGARNRELVEPYYIENCARRYEELFEEVLREQVAAR